MGSRSNLYKAYIAGFLDGDGSLMLQVKARSDTKSGVRFMATICFYQDTRHEKALHWIQKVLRIGYLSRRSDGITELRINGFKQVKKILNELQPFLRFKSKQASVLMRACEILERKPLNNLSNTELRKLISLIFKIRRENYKSRRAMGKNALYKRLGLTP